MLESIPRRNVRVFSSSNGTEVAGFFQHGGVSVSTFFGWIKEVCQIDGEWALYPCQFDNNRAAGGAALDSGSGDELERHYVIRTPPPESTQIPVYLTTDVPRTRAYSDNCTRTPLDTNFVTRIRNRDRRCCITGQLVAGGDYTGFEAAHIFPLSETDIWQEMNFQRYIEDDQIAPGFESNSIQQGFLCSSTEHRMFDDYSIGVNPDVRTMTITLSTIFRYLPCAELLRDHFRQCVLRHVKGAGEDNDAQWRFDPDIDLGAGGFNLETGSWWSGPEGKKHLEAELAGRLWGSFTLKIGHSSELQSV